MDFMMPHHQNLPFKKIGKNCQISHDALILGRENIEIGDNVRIDAGVKILASKGYLKIGNHVHIACNSVLSCGGGIEMGDHSGLSFDCKLISAMENHRGPFLMNPNVPAQYRNPTISPIILETFATVFAGSVVLAGALMKRGSILGAMSLLKSYETIPAGAIYAGTPATQKGLRYADPGLMAVEFEKEYLGVPQDEPQDG